jgi:hypothetical protein
MKDQGPIRLPATFYYDHQDRDLPTPYPVHTTKRHVYVAADDADLLELLSDARHYASDQGWDPSLRGLQASARATIKAIEGRA